VCYNYVAVDKLGSAVPSTFLPAPAGLFSTFFLVGICQYVCYNGSLALDVAAISSGINFWLFGQRGNASKVHELQI